MLSTPPGLLMTIGACPQCAQPFIPQVSVIPTVQVLSGSAWDDNKIWKSS